MGLLYCWCPVFFSGDARVFQVQLVCFVHAMIGFLHCFLSVTTKPDMSAMYFLHFTSLNDELIYLLVIVDAMLLCRYSKLGIKINQNTLETIFFFYIKMWISLDIQRSLSCGRDPRLATRKAILDPTQPEGESGWTQMDLNWNLFIDYCMKSLNSL